MPATRADYRRAAKRDARTLTIEQVRGVIASATDAERLAMAGPGWEIGPDGRRRCWLSQEETAKAFGITTRHLRRLEERGLPAEGWHDTCRYPWPHAGVWYREYQLRIKPGDPPGSLNIEDAFDAHHMRNAVELAEIDIRMRHDPQFRRRMESVDREDAADILEVRARLVDRRRASAQRGRPKPSGPVAQGRTASEPATATEVMTAMQEIDEHPTLDAEGV